MSSPVRAVVDNLRTIIVWLFFMIVPTNIPEEFRWLQLIGFILLVVGTVIYNEVLVLPCGGFDQNTAAAKLIREGKPDRTKSIATAGTKGSFVHK